MSDARPDGEPGPGTPLGRPDSDETPSYAPLPDDRRPAGAPSGRIPADEVGPGGPLRNEPLPGGPGPDGAVLSEPLPAELVPDGPGSDGTGPDRTGNGEPRAGASREVRVRRGPKVPVFIVVGAVLGVIGAAVLLQVTPHDANYSPAQAFGFVALVLATIGAAIGGAVAVVLDRVSIRRSRVVVAERLRETAAPRIGDPDAVVASPDQEGDDAPADPAEIQRHAVPEDDGFDDDGLPRPGVD